MNYTLVKPSDPILHETMPLVDTTQSLAGLRPIAVGMWEVMRKPNEFDMYGIGLGAPQVGERVRMFVLHYYCTKQRFNMADVCINPSWKPAPDAVPTPFRESCLTWPGRFVEVSRVDHGHGTWTTLSGKQVTRELYGIMARAFQHELDHLNGRTIL